MRAFNAGQALPVADLPVVEVGTWRDAVVAEVGRGGRLLALFGTPWADALRLFAVVGHDVRGRLAALAADVPGEAYPALTPDCPQAHAFERELAEQWGLRPEGHPWLKPLRFHAAGGPGRAAGARSAGARPAPGVTDYFRVAGPDAHQVAVGPVHAGIIEPGHFRFQCHGETVLNLEIQLGYQHRGIERALVGGPDRRTVAVMETLAGDTTVGHATAYAQAVEALAGAQPPLGAQALRAIGLELERLANHTGDLGALAADVGFLPTAAYCGRLRGEFLNMTALVCGNRFGRGWVAPGGARWDLDRERAGELAIRLKRELADLAGAVDLLWNSPSVMARFEDTGALTAATAEELGLVGPAARATGLPRDARHDYPSDFYRFAQVPVATETAGDVFARAMVRWLEIRKSGEFLRERFAAPPAGPLAVPVPALRPDALAVTLVEGWRGEVCHVAVTGADGRFRAYKVVDPSFHNWQGLAMALRDQPISDFPLCNKSFNLSYCGHDL